MTSYKKHIDSLFYLLDKHFLIQDYETCKKIVNVLMPVHFMLPERFFQIGVVSIEPNQVLKFSQKFLVMKEASEDLKVRILIDMINFQIIHEKYSEAYEQLSTYLTILPYETVPMLFGMAALLTLYFNFTDDRWKNQCNTYFIKYFEMEDSRVINTEMFKYYYNFIEHAE